jgi:hypothetical protein
LRARVNGDLPLEFSDVALTSYAGLGLFGRYLRATGFNRMVREAWAGTVAWSDFGAVAMVRLLVGLVLVGGRRLRPPDRRSLDPRSSIADRRSPIVRSPIARSPITPIADCRSPDQAIADGPIAHSIADHRSPIADVYRLMS